MGIRGIEVLGCVFRGFEGNSCLHYKDEGKMRELMGNFREKHWNGKRKDHVKETPTKKEILRRFSSLV